jgi:cytochrome c553
MRKSALILIALIAIVTTLFSFTKAEENTYKNLKVLPKNTTKQELDSVMKHFSMSLGVRCNFCHVRLENEKKDWDFASDKNEHKDVARDMMRMAVKINKKYFKDENKDANGKQVANAITCFTCHNGKEEPGRIPPAPPRPDQPRPEQPKPTGK